MRLSYSPPPPKCRDAFVIVWNDMKIKKLYDSFTFWNIYNNALMADLVSSVDKH